MTTDYDAFTRLLIDAMRSHGGQVTTGPMAGRPLMVLTTKGAKSGEERTAIVTYTRDAQRYCTECSDLLGRTRSCQVMRRAGPVKLHVARDVTAHRQRRDQREQRDPQRPSFLTCDHGYSSSLAAATLHDLGFYQATDVNGGFQA